jgi:carboxypeptidase Taq
MVIAVVPFRWSRNKQKAALAAVIYEKQTDPALGRLIRELQDDWAFYRSANRYELANLRDAARDYALQVGKSKEMAMREAELEGKGYGSWVKARKENDFAGFKPVLEEILALRKEVVKATRPNMNAYDGCIDMFERGMTVRKLSGCAVDLCSWSACKLSNPFFLLLQVERLNEVFGAVKTELVPLIKAIQESRVNREYRVPAALQGGENWSVEVQKAICREFAEAIGFDFSKGRFDVSVHPFTGGSHPTDVRITTRYSTANWKGGVAGTVHEVGHALYEQGRSEEYVDLPVSRSLSMGVHESQSLFWERMIHQSREFWEWATPLMHKHFPHTRDCTADDFYRAVNRVEPGLIRVDADEVTYPMHIILRFELESGIMSDRIALDDLPRLWNQKMKSSLNVDVPNDAKGVLQDVHWAVGAVGYFPSYTLGAMIAAQLFQRLEQEMPDVRDKIRRGDFKPIREWLQRKIHGVGSLYPSPDELLVHATGKPMDPSIFVSYLKTKYAALYGLDANERRSA